MSSIKLKRLATASFVALLTLLALSTAAARAETSIKIGLSPPDIAHLPLWVADAKNLFKAEGVNVQLVQFESDSAAAQGLTAGATQMNSGSVQVVMDSYAGGRDLTIHHRWRPGDGDDADRPAGDRADSACALH